MSLNGRTLVARVTLVTEAPLSISMPVAERQTANRWENFPVMGMGVDAAGKPSPTGYLPATTLRGALRRFTVLPVMEAAAASGKPYSLSQAYMALIGQDADSEKQPDEIDLVAIQAAREADPIVDLFGSGLGVRSRLLVSNLVPARPVLPEAFTNVRKDLDEGVLKILGAADQDVYLKRNAANARRSQAQAQLKKLKRELGRKRKTDDAPDDAPDDLSAQVAAAAELVKRHAGEMGEMAVSTRGIFTFYALPMGLELTGKLVVRNFRDRDLEILRRGFDGLSRQPVLGAQSARGCGEVSGKADFEIDGAVERTIRFGGYRPLQEVALPPFPSGKG